MEPPASSAGLFLGGELPAPPVPGTGVLAVQATM
jgi:hypothetical protein